ncbi:MAG: hypothetical protein QM722_10035 [Piscinibacter sp.]
MTPMPLLMLALGLATGAVQAQTAAKPQPRTPPPAAPAAQPAAPTQDRADIDRTQIIGNRELPKVLYIVPWKKPLPGDLAGRPGGGVLDEALAPVDRDVFRRQVQYDAQLQPPKSPTTPAAAPARP